MESLQEISCCQIHTRYVQGLINARTYVNVLLCAALAGSLAAAEAPHHLNHPTGRLTAADIARDFTRQHTQVAADSLYVAKEYRTQHNGVTHIVYQQQYRGLDV